MTSPSSTPLPSFAAHVGRTLFPHPGISDTPALPLMCRAKKMEASNTASGKAKCFKCISNKGEENIEDTIELGFTDFIPAIYVP